MRLPLLTLLVVAALQARGQFTETFADSNFTAAPPWSGTAGAWIVNPQRELQSAATAANSSFFLSTPSSLAEAQWELGMRLAFSTSSANYVDVWLMSSTADPEAAGNSGYFVRVGGTQDDICLYRKSTSGVVTRLIDGPDGTVGSSDNRLRLQAYRGSGGTFFLRHATDGGPTVSDGQATDATYSQCTYFALLVRQSTSSFFGRHYFDDIRVTPFIPDTLAPRIEWIGAPADSTVEIRFSEPVDATSATSAAYFQVVGLGVAVSATPDPADGARLWLRFAQGFPPDSFLLLTVHHIRDAWGNELLQDTDRFLYHPPRRHDLLISEIMADPDPPQGLPPEEYIELHNRCRYPVALRGWRIGKGSALSAPFPDCWLQPDSFLVLTGTGQAASFAPFATTIGVASFPALDNDGALLQLLSADGRSIHSVDYSRSWYGSSVKEDGGWSLEMIDEANPCGGAHNWQASVAAAGGTPGGSNSVAARNADRVEPHLLRSFTPDSLHVLLRFSEPLDSSTAVAGSYSIEDGPAVLSARALPPLFESVELTLASPLQRGMIYQAIASGPCDCAGNPLGNSNRVPVGLPGEAAPGSIVLNEILYSPQPGGAEYIEVLARDRALDLSRLFVATRSSAGSIRTPVRLSPEKLQAFPGEHHVFTPDDADVRQRYFVARPDCLHPLPALPALPDEGTALLLLDERGTVLDEVPYSPKWQFALIDDAHGVALERLDPAGSSTEKGNWHSAATTSGYGTPTARNSQFRNGAAEGSLTVTPSVFSPDNDGFDDVAVIAYELEESGYLANMTIFDASGRPVRLLLKNGLLGRTGRLAWDGLDEQQRPLPAGVYVLFAELLHPEGKRTVFKRAVTIARKQ